MQIKRRALRKRSTKAGGLAIAKRSKQVIVAASRMLEGMDSNLPLNYEETPEMEKVLDLVDKAYGALVDARQAVDLAIRKEARKR